MSSYASVYLSDGRPVCSFRNGVDQLFFILFTSEDWIELGGAEALRLANWKRGTNDDDVRVAGFRASAGALRDRLDLLGVPRSSVTLELERLAAERLRFLVDFRKHRASMPDLGSEDDQEIAYLASLTWDRWLADLQKGLGAGEKVERWGQREPFGSASWLMSLWDDHDDTRYQFRAVLEAVSRDEEITLDLDDLLEGGWLEPSIDPREHARELVAYTSQGGLAPIVLTEGRFDVEVLTAALMLRRPHLIGYIKLPDFAQKNEGGAAALRQTVRALAAAGIPNRVVALFDNGTAARDVLFGVDSSLLPANLVLTRLPDLDLASAYPTVGPQGEHVMDVNGLAGSIEMYLGSDVLTVGGELQPVLWGGYVSRLRQYQGEISDKERVHARFRDKVAAARLCAEVMDDQDWSGLDLVLEHVVDLVRHITLPGP